jgi:hypothetical protein
MKETNKHVSLVSVLTMRILMSLMSYVVGVAGVHADVTPASEVERIEYLIRSVEAAIECKVHTQWFCSRLAGCSRSLAPQAA